MPGLIGLTTVTGGRENTRTVLRQMQDLVTHQAFYERDELFLNSVLCATRSHLGTTQREPQPYHKDGIYIWLDGEFYNQEEISTHHGSANSDPEILHALFGRGSGVSSLKQIDGIFSAIIYDSIKQEIHLMTDRYGFGYLYWTIHNGGLVWASEVKAMLALPGFEPRIDLTAVNEFFDFGYLLGNRTWFEGVELLSPATVLTWNIGRQSLRKQRYWSWEEIRPLPEPIDEEEIAGELGRLFIDAVERRCQKGERVGLMLSGGLDSRAILAAMPERVYPIHAVTYGKKGCDDVRFASAAARMKGAIHEVFEINGENWFITRLDGVWWTDGQKNLMHMHEIETLPHIRGFFDISLDGFLGDATLGGGYLNDRRFSEIEKIENRGRRFILLGPKYTEVYVRERVPFFDNQLVNLTLAIPERLRANSRIYIQMLLRTFPEFYQTIPWQKIGFPITASVLITKAVVLLRRVKDRIISELGRIGCNYDNPNYFTDYPNWIRQEPARSFFKSALTNPSAIYPAYISSLKVHRDLSGHFEGQDKAENLCRYLTFEVWLQQVFEKRYRPSHV